ncbi:2-hydroxyisoflavanone dehydratase-like [Carica papaya]|uniref:2-hydroxyisoflavanone dehydratase-like n=1 Tax=Carica papaya TaxID=3649 RepID=UPI000B8C7132|nr:2-hydroxyisoflavanone dehydratase-like [Carica papaya]
MGSIADHDHKEVATELLPYIRIYKDGCVERLMGSPTVPPPNDTETGVSSKDVIISETPLISARLYLPKHVNPNQKLPILVYFHGGAFIFESAFSFLETKFMNRLVAEARAVAVSVDYRLAPEHLLPSAYDDCWAALRWVASHSAADTTGINPDPWLLNHANFERVFIGGDSAGANIAHNIAMRAGSEELPGGVELLGAFTTHPYFWGWKPIGEERKEGLEQKLPYLLWKFLYPTAPGGIECPMINPHGEGAPSLSGLGCSQLLVSTTDMDGLRHRAFAYYNGVKESGWEGEAELVVVEGEPHGFHTCNYESESAKQMIKRLASFLLK